MTEMDATAERVARLARDPEAVARLSPEQRRKLGVVLEAFGKRAKRDRYFDLYPAEGPLSRRAYSKHMEHFAAGKWARERAVLGGNRVGKTEIGAYEMTAHLTGLYPEWWQGRRFDTAVHAWAAGKTNDTTKNILQEKLFGGVRKDERDGAPDSTAPEQEDATASPVTDALKRVREFDPDVADSLEQVLSPFQERLYEAERKLAERADAERRRGIEAKLAEVDAAVPGWRKDVQTEEFAAWFDQQPGYWQAAFQQTEDSADIIEIFSSYTSYRSSVNGSPASEQPGREQADNTAPAASPTAQRERLTSLLLEGPEAHGFPTPLWSCPRVARLIGDEFGVAYHAGHAWKILRALDWSPQRPAGKARERNEERIRTWKRKTWKRIKKKPKTKAVRSSSSTKAD